MSHDYFTPCCRTNRIIKRDIERRKKEKGKKRKEDSRRMRDEEIKERGEGM